MSGPLSWDSSERHRVESAEKNVALTPPWLVERIRADLFGGAIDLDPCTTPENPTRAATFIALPEDGILAPWDGARIYCNPPYGSTCGKWVEKCIVAEGQGSRVVLLVPARTETRWFQRALSACEDCLLLDRRLKFSNAASSAPFPNALFGFGLSLAPLADLGTIVRRAAA